MLLARHDSTGRLRLALAGVVILAACGKAQATGGQPTGLSQPFATTSARPSGAPPASAQSADQLVTPAPLVDPGLDLRAGPVDLPLELRIPSLRITASVLGVGLTSKNVMDTPVGAASDPVWRKAFWYRGGGIPGDASTATIANIHGKPSL